MGMLKDAKVATRLPAKDLNRARAFYSEKLGLEPVEQREGRLRYVCAAGEFAIFVSAGVQSGTHTQMSWEVDNIEPTVRELRARGVEFEEYDLPGLRTVDGIAEITGNYPSKGTGERVAWFRDSEGNLGSVLMFISAIRLTIRLLAHSGHDRLWESAFAVAIGAKRTCPFALHMSVL